MDIESVVDSGSRPKRCIVIAIDGARRDYLERYEAPCMRKLAEEGVGFRNAIASNGLAETANGITAIGLQTSSPSEAHIPLGAEGVSPSASSDTTLFVVKPGNS
ncbi:MAG: alkaline phosphatase family protein [Candidatus Binatia bacterium]